MTSLPRPRRARLACASTLAAVALGTAACSSPEPQDQPAAPAATGSAPLGGVSDPETSDQEQDGGPDETSAATGSGSSDRSPIRATASDPRFDLTMPFSEVEVEAAAQTAVNFADAYLDVDYASPAASRRVEAVTPFLARVHTVDLTVLTPSGSAIAAARRDRLTVGAEVDRVRLDVISSRLVLFDLAVTSTVRRDGSPDTVFEQTYTVSVIPERDQWRVQAFNLPEDEGGEGE